MELIGLHGTSRSRADNILKSNFKPYPGRAGKGIYFWRENAFSKIIAKSWFNFSLKKNNYDLDADKNFAYFKVKISVNEENFLDLELPELKDQLAVIAEKRNIDRKTREDVISALFDYFIDTLEKELKTSFKVWQARVNAPYDCVEYPLSLLGNPICYVVIDSACISICSCYVLENGHERQIYQSC